MTAAEFRAALARMRLSPADFGTVLAVLDPRRPKASHVREAYRLASPANLRPIPSAMRALVTIMEFVQPKDWLADGATQERFVAKWLDALGANPAAPS